MAIGEDGIGRDDAILLVVRFRDVGLAALGIDPAARDPLGSVIEPRGVGRRGRRRRRFDRLGACRFLDYHCVAG